jgi:hypothetical protein
MFDQALPANLSQYVPNALEPSLEVGTALLALPVAAILGSALAFRPKRRGTPARSATVIQTQIRTPCGTVSKRFSRATK